MNPFANIPIVVNKFACERVVPNRKHERPRWDRRGSYHRRIQKKWNKRFGTHIDHYAHMANGRLYVSQKIMDILIEKSKRTLAAKLFFAGLQPI